MVLLNSTSGVFISAYGDNLGLMNLLILCLVGHYGYFVAGLSLFFLSGRISNLVTRNVVTDNTKPEQGSGGNSA